MNRHVNAIAGRLSLRPPQRRSLEILDRITEIVPPRKDVDVASALAAIRRACKLDEPLKDSAAPEQFTATRYPDPRSTAS